MCIIMTETTVIDGMVGVIGEAGIIETGMIGAATGTERDGPREY